MSFPCHGGYDTITRQEVLRMRNEFTAVVEKDGEWYVAYCLQVPGANG